MVLAPVIKGASGALGGGGGAMPGARLSHLAHLSSRRSEPKLQFVTADARSPVAVAPWRLARWPTSPVKRLSAPECTNSAVVVSSSNLSGSRGNQGDDHDVDVVCERSTSPGGEASALGQWKRQLIAAGPEETPETRISLAELRSSLESIRTALAADAPRITPSLTAETEFGREATLMRTTLYEELEEFRASPEDKVKLFPDYFSAQEKATLQRVAEGLRLGCQIGETTISVYKVGLQQPPPPPQQQSPTVATTGPHAPQVHSHLHHRPDDVFVDVPSLVQHGKDGFIARLRLQRLSSGSGLRRKMLWDVAQLATTTDGVADPVAEGDGGVYAVASRSSGIKLAMFKPAEEEKFVRDGIAPGEGAVREEAAYVLDARANGFSGVPPTAVARLQLANIGQPKQGAVQRFMMGSIGSMESFGMPFDLAAASAFVPVDQVQRVALLDIRTFNTDRHPGNILLIGDKPPYTMVPIDHGCILPSWFHLAEARFDWLEYPQCRVPLSAAAVAYVEALDAEADAVVLRRLGIREECITTLKICTLLLQLAVHAGRSLHWMGTFMQREGCFESPSALERAVHRACEATGLPMSFVPNAHGELKAEIPRGVLSRRPPTLFFSHLERILSVEVANEC